MEIVYSVVIGLLAGALSGMFGIGGGILIVPALAILLGFEQKKAQGTSLAVLLAPIGLFGVLNYHKQNMIDWKAAGIIAAGFVAGVFGGSSLALNLPELMVRRSFAVFLIAVAAYMWFKPGK